MWEMFQNIENIIFVSPNTVILIIVIVKVTWCLHKRIIYSHSVLVIFFYRSVLGYAHRVLTQTRLFIRAVP